MVRYKLTGSYQSIITSITNCIEQQSSNGMAAMNISRNGEELTRHLKSQLFPVTVFISVEAFVGFFGNIAILIVYSKQYRHVNFKYFVLALAFVDLLSCCTTLPGEIFSHQNWYDYKYTWVCKVKSYFNAYTALASASVLLTLAIDRHRKVCHPFGWQIRFHVAFRLCVCCLVISAIVSTPMFLFWGTRSFLYSFKGGNFTVSVCEKSGDYAETIYPLLYISGVFLIPISIMIVVAMALNFTIACRLCSQSSSAKHSSIKDFDCGRTRQEINAEPKTSDSKSGTAEGKRTENKTENSEGSVKESPFDPLTVSKENFLRNVKPMQELSTDIFSTDEEFTDNLRSDIEELGTTSTNKKPSGKKSHKSCWRKKRRPVNRRSSKPQRRNKTMIMLILTSIFAVTMATYIALIIFVAKPNGILKEMSDSTKPVFFFFWRLYFVNSVVNPILYGFMDPGFRSGFIYYLQRGKTSVTNTSTN